MAVGGAAGQAPGSRGAVAGAVTPRSVSPGPRGPLSGVTVTARSSGGGAGHALAGGGVGAAGGRVGVAPAAGRVHHVVVGVGIDLFGGTVARRVRHHVMSGGLGTRRNSWRRDRANGGMRRHLGPQVEIISEGWSGSTSGSISTN